MSGGTEGLSPYRCSVHTHTTLCDGRDTPEAMAEAAYRAGVRHYGFSGHSYTDCPLDRGSVLPADPAEYRNRVLALREEYADRMEILLGIELDSFSPTDPAAFDYWIGSVHHVRNGYGEEYTVDWDAARFAGCRDRGFGGDALALCGAYYRAVSAMAARRPTILGHLDLVTKYNEGRAFFDETAPRYRRAALDALHAADPAATLLEINTGAMSKGYRTAPYPAPFLLEEWRRMGGRVILTADAHRTEHILYGYREAAEAARAAGFRCAAVLTRTGVRECPL